MKATTNTRRPETPPFTPAGIRLAVGLTLTLVAATAQAGGFASATFGGEHGHPTEGNPTAIYFNPAGMALEGGTQVMAEVDLVLLTASYERFPEAISRFGEPDFTNDEIRANSGKGEINNFLQAPFIGVVTDFGTDLPLAVGAAFYAPFGGSTAFDEVPVVAGYPGSIDGPARWAHIEGTIQTLSVSAGVAYQFEGPRLSVGLTGNLHFSLIDSLRAFNPDGTDDLLTPTGALKEGRSRSEARSIDPGAGIGLLWEAVEDILWIGASYQSQPNFGRTMVLTGEVDNVFSVSRLSTADMTLTQELPDIVRLGVRWRPSEHYELRLAGNYQRWSVFENQCVVNTEVNSDVDAVCQFREDGGPTADNPSPEAVVTNVPRNWTDTFGVQLSGSYWVSPSLELVAGFAYDGNAAPDDTLEAGLPDFEKLVGALGGTVGLTDWMDLMLTVTNVFYLERDTRGVATTERLAVPSRQPSSAGIYHQNALIFGVNLGVHLAPAGEPSSAAPSPTPPHD